MTDIQTEVSEESSAAQRSATELKGASLRVPQLPKTLLVILTLLVLALLPWIRFGLNVGFTADDWWLFDNADQGNVVNWALSRPLTDLTFAVAHVIDTDSFSGPNLLLAGTLFLKALLIFGIVKTLIRREDVAFAIAALFLIFPADQAIFNLGTLTYYFMLACYLLAVYLFVTSYRKLNILFLVVMGLALGISMLINEVEFPLVFVTPILLLCIAPRLNRRFWLFTALWYLVPILVVGRLILLQAQFPQGLSYEQSLYAGIPTIAQALSSFGLVFQNVFVEGWTGYFFSQASTLDWVIGILGGAAVLGVMWTLATKTEGGNIRTWVTGILVGLAIIILGFVLYLPTQLRMGGGRTLVYSSLGGAVVLGIVIYLLARLLRNTRFWMAIGLSVFVALGIVSLERQHISYKLNSDGQQDVLRSIVGQLPRIKSGSMVVIFESTSNHVVGGRFGSSTYLSSALQLVYKDSTLNSAICYPEANWGGFKETCSFTPNGLQLKYSDAVQWTEPYQNLIALEYTTSGTMSLITNLQMVETAAVDVSAYNPDALFDTRAAKPLRAQTMLGMTP